MSRKDNFRKAAFDMFGVGRDPDGRETAPEAAEAPAEPLTGVDALMEEDTAALAGAFVEAIRQTEPAPPPAPKYQTTILAAGSVFEGTLRAKGGVDLACEFRGNIFAEGDVVMRTSLEGNVQGKCVELISCAVHGDIQAGSMCGSTAGPPFRAISPPGISPVRDG